jgi:hypothetical protein
MLYSTFASIEEGENQRRRKAGLPPVRFGWNLVRAIVTRFDASQRTDLVSVTWAYFGDLMNTYRQEFTALVADRIVVLECGRMRRLVRRERSTSGRSTCSWRNLSVASG